MHSSQYDEIYALIVERTKQLRLGCALSQPQDGFVPTVDCGAMITGDRFGELERLVTEAVQDGAHLEVGGSRWKHAYLEEGSYFAPTVVGDVQQGMEISQKECTWFPLKSHLVFYIWE